MSNSRVVPDEADPADANEGRGAATASGDATSHLDDVPDGAGCTEIWERLSDHRADD